MKKSFRGMVPYIFNHFYSSSSLKGKREQGRWCWILSQQTFHWFWENHWRRDSPQLRFQVFEAIAYLEFSQLNGFSKISFHTFNLLVLKKSRSFETLRNRIWALVTLWKSVFLDFTGFNISRGSGMGSKAPEKEAAQWITFVNKQCVIDREPYYFLITA